MMVTMFVIFYRKYGFLLFIIEFGGSIMCVWREKIKFAHLKKFSQYMMTGVKRNGDDWFK